MGRINYLLSGAFLGGALVLNQVYETERLHETIRSQEEERERINTMVMLHCSFSA